MQGYQVSETASQSMSGRPMLGPLIEAVGTSCFPKLLFDSIQNNVECVHLSAFASDHGAEAMILAENRGSTRLSYDARQHYLINRPKPCVTGDAGDKRLVETFVFEITPSRVGYSALSSSCYAAPSVAGRFSISETRQSRTLRLNFYSARSFASQELDYIKDHASVLMPLVWRHGKDCFKDKESDSELEARLKQVAPHLTHRENQVCALIALGVTSEGIAIRLSMGLNTVLTYRKRAYKRLGISSQNELFRLIWAPQRPS